MLVGEVLVGWAANGDGMPGQGALAHVGQRLGIDHGVGVAGPRQLQEIEAALGAVVPGEVLVAECAGPFLP